MINKNVIKMTEEKSKNSEKISAIII